MKNSQKHKELKVELVLYILSAINDVLKKKGFEQEPLWIITDKKIAALDGILKRVFICCYGIELYPKIEDKAANIFYNIIKNHEFENGNKRTALIVLATFVSINNLWIKTKSKNEMVELAQFVAESMTEDREYIINHITKFLYDRLEVSDKL